MKFLNKTIEYGLYLLVFLLPIQTRWIIKPGELNGGPFEYGTYSLYATDMLLILVLLLFVVCEIASLALAMTEKVAARNNKISNDKLIWWFIGGWLLTSAVSIFFAADKLLALYKFGWLILGAGLFYLIISASYNKIKLIYAMLSGMFLQAVLGVWQFLTQSSFANKWLGLALHNAADLGTSVVEAVGADGIGERWLRAYGGLDHPNVLGGMVAVGLLFLVIEIIKFCKMPNLDGQLSIKFKNIFNIITWVFLVVFSGALFFSFSRSAWLGLAIGLIVIMALAIAGRNLKLQKGLAEIILIMGVLLFILFSQYQNLITSRLGGEGRLEIKSTSERLVSYRESWQMIKNNWLTGAGIGNYTLALSREVTSKQNFYYQPVHNVFLLVWAEIGIFGLLFFIGLLLAVVMGVRCQTSKGRLTSGNAIDVGRPLDARRLDSLVAILIALVVIMTFDHWLFSLHFGVLFFWLVMGLVLKMGEKDVGHPIGA